MLPVPMNCFATDVPSVQMYARMEQSIISVKKSTTMVKGKFAELQRLMKQSVRAAVHVP